jgi:hypothetical protein
MKGALSGTILFILTALALWGCANIVPPGGGPKDETPPKLRSITPPDSQLNTRVKEIEMQFDEYIELRDAAAQVQISPLLSLPLTVTAQVRRVKVTIPDSLLEGETTYRITFGTAIRDIHEGNPWNSKGYTFSTGSYFDSLSIAGTVFDASRGLPDTTSVVLLYSAAESDSAIVRHKPMYATHVDALGNFLLEGLPPRAFRLYALRDLNSNLTFDGGAEWVAFADSVIRPAVGDASRANLYIFPESLGDTSHAAAPAGRSPFGDRARPASASSDIAPASYRVVADTADAGKRTQDITKPLAILLGRRLSGTMNPARIFLASDSAGATVEAPLRITRDTSGLEYYLVTDWREDAVYTLRLQKGFATDSSGAELMPGRFSFRTRRDEDYGRLRIHLPAKYYGSSHILQVSNERDTIYQQPVTDTMVNLLRIVPGIYSMRIIEDANENGRWDAGDLFLRRQPELVVPYGNTIQLKAGWEQQVDFIAPRRRSLDEEH